MCRIRRNDSLSVQKKIGRQEGWADKSDKSKSPSRPWPASSLSQCIHAGLNKF